MPRVGDPRTHQWELQKAVGAMLGLQYRESLQTFVALEQLCENITKNIWNKGCIPARFSTVAGMNLSELASVPF